MNEDKVKLTYFESFKKEIKYAFVIILVISLSVVFFGYMFKLAWFITDYNSILGAGMYVFLALSILGIFASVISAGWDHYEEVSKT